MPSKKPRKPAPSKKPKRRKSSLGRLASYAVDTGIPDLAAEHDQYLYGTPKRGKSAKRNKI